MNSITVSNNQFAVEEFYQGADEAQVWPIVLNWVEKQARGWAGANLSYDERQDLVSRVMEKIYAKRHTYRPVGAGGAQWTSWAGTIIRNERVNILRQRQRETALANYVVDTETGDAQATWLEKISDNQLLFRRPDGFNQGWPESLACTQMVTVIWLLLDASLQALPTLTLCYVALDVVEGALGYLNGDDVDLNKGIGFGWHDLAKARTCLQILAGKELPYWLVEVLAQVETGLLQQLPLYQIYGLMGANALPVRRSQCRNKLLKSPQFAQALTVLALQFDYQPPEAQKLDLRRLVMGLLEYHTYRHYYEAG